MATVRLIGEGIGYSASPHMHAAAFAALGLNHTYELADVRGEELPAAVDELRASDFLGANVTVPYKATVMGRLDDVDPLATRADAVNTIVKRDGTLTGLNTDIPAIVDEVRRLAGVPRRTVILGAGGAARAAALALESMGANDTVMVSRAAWPTLPSLLPEADLLVNATPLGTNADESPLDAGSLHRGLAVLDLVYRPSPTTLVREARNRRLSARSGAGVLLGQGWRSLEAWLGRAVSDDVKRAMADALCRELGAGADV